MEKRYAIIIGINDYQTGPLDYCVNDARSIAEILEKRARFDPVNIHLITSDTSQSTKDITGKLFEAVGAIQNDFQADEDSIFFYFAGHGISDSSNSYLAFHDSRYSIANVFNTLGKLTPKMQFYVIDACESGSKTLTRGLPADKDAEIDELIAASSGALFLYACQSTESALEEDAMQHGVMTHYFLESISTHTLYDEDGILTPGRIQEYVAKKVATHSNFVQVPVIENRVVGYYPFAFAKPSLPSTQVPMVPAVAQSARAVSFIKPNEDARQKLQDTASAFLVGAFEEFLKGKFEGFERRDFDDCESIDLEMSNKIKDKIVSDAQGKYRSIGSIIYEREEPIYDSYQNLFNPMIQLLGKRPEPTGYRKVPEIDYSNKFYDSVDIGMFSPTIWKVSFGMGAVTYQAKWGGVVSPYYYLIDWDGEKDAVIGEFRKYNYTYLVDEESLELIPKMEIQLFGDLLKSLEKWNRDREEELKDFKIKKT